MALNKADAYSAPKTSMVPCSHLISYRSLSRFAPGIGNRYCFSSYHSGSCCFRHWRLDACLARKTRMVACITHVIRSRSIFLFRSRHDPHCLSCRHRGSCRFHHRHLLAGKTCMAACFSHLIRYRLLALLDPGAGWRQRFGSVCRVVSSIHRSLVFGRRVRFIDRALVAALFAQAQSHT